MPSRSVLVVMLALVMSVAHAQSQFTAHPCRNKPADAIAEVVRPLLPQREDIQLIVDRQRNQLLLNGPPALQEWVSRVVRESDVTEIAPSPSQPGETSFESGGTAGWPSANLQPPPGRVADPRYSLFADLPRGRLESVQQQLAAIFGSRMQPAQPSDGLTWLLTLRSSPQPVRLQFDLVRSGVRITGATPVVGQLQTLIGKLAEPAAEGYRTQVFRVQRENHAQLRGTVKSLGTQKPNRLGAVNPNDQSRLVLPKGTIGTIRPAVFQNSPSRPSDDAGAASEDVMRQFEGVEIESLPELDVIILRGRDPDLKQLAEVIEQLERISQETQPEIRVLPLKHASSEAVAAIIEESNEALVSGRQGRVSVTPLVKPNALLLIGWGDAVTAIVELAQQLDTPVDANTQSAIFRLEHASAQAVSDTIEQFLSGREGMGPRASIAIDERTNSLIVYASPRDMQEVAKLVKDLDQPGGKSVHHTQVFPIQNALAADVAETLEAAIGEQTSTLALEVTGADGSRIVHSGSLDQVKITPNARNNTLIVTSPIENMQLIEALIRQLDTPAGQVQLKIFQIINGDATSMVETLRSLLPSQSSTSTATVQLSSAEGETSLIPLRFSVDLRSNSIIATGGDGDLQIVEALLIRLDQSTDQQRKSTVIQLKNAPAVDVAAAINQYLLNQRQIDQAVPGQRSPFQEIEREVVVVPEPVANKLILAATPRYYDEIKALIDKLDEQPPQVLIQVLIAEVALNNIHEFGIEMGVQSSVLFDRSLLGDLLTTTNTRQDSTAGGVTTITEQLIRAASNIPGFIFNNVDPLGNSGSSQSLGSAGVVGGQAISNFAVGRGNEDAGFGGLVLSASSRNVSVLLRALNESRQVRVLSRPQVRTLDNQPAYIQVGQRVPRIIGSTVNQNGQSNSITLENVGLILGVTPRVSPDNTVVMEIDAERSKLGEEEDGVPVAVAAEGTVIRSPAIDTITAQATVSAANGETIILGGLITENRKGIQRRVPVIQNIPILKHLFKFDSDEWLRAELLIILTPHVVRSVEDSERLKQMEVARMNWCECDVFRVHGDINVSQVSYTDYLDSSQPPVIYPDLNPSGELEPIDVQEVGSRPFSVNQMIDEAVEVPLP